MHSWLPTYEPKRVSADEAVKHIQSQQRVFVDANCSAPRELLAAFSRRAPELRWVEVVQLLAFDKVHAPEVSDLEKHVRHNALFIGPAVRQAVNEGRADYTPVFLSEIPRLFRERRLALDVALIQVSPPDEHGYCSFGVSVDITKAAAESAKLVIAEVNKQMPRTLGDSFIHVDRLHCVVDADYPIRQIAPEPFTDVHKQIAEHVAGLIDDGDTLQLGIGAIPNAVLAALKDHRALGVHTEMFSDGVLDLYERGVITGERKTLHAGKIVSSFIMGTERLYKFVHDNPAIEMHPSEYTNDPFVIAQHDNMVAVNSAISVDLTGQVNADSIGPRFYSGFGGQVDFIRGATRSKGGKPIIALPSTAKDQSRIVPMLAAGSGVVTTRADVHYVVTEYGVADLFGKSVRQRSQLLIDIAHPNHREALERALAG